MMWMERDGFWERMSLPNSTMDTKWPIGGDGYRTIAFCFSMGCVCELCCKE